MGLKRRFKNGVLFLPPHFDIFIHVHGVYWKRNAVHLASSQHTTHPETVVGVPAGRIVLQQVGPIGFGT